MCIVKMTYNDMQYTYLEGNLCRHERRRAPLQTLSDKRKKKKEGTRREEKKREKEKKGLLEILTQPIVIFYKADEWYLDSDVCFYLPI